MRGAVIPGAVSRHAPAHSAVGNGLKAAAVTGGVLALVMPALTVDVSPIEPVSADAALHLASGQQAVEPARGVRIGAAVVDEDTNTLMLASVIPVDQDDEPEPPEAGAAELLKAAGLFDLARQQEEQREARAAAIGCDASLGGLGRVKPWVRTAAQFLSCLYGEPRLIGVASRGSSYSGHPGGLAVDFIVSGAKGDRLAECALRNRDALGVDYIIYKQRINYGDGWERMSDRGGSTANHFDHVHVSFVRGGPGGRPLADVCG